MTMRWMVAGLAALALGGCGGGSDAGNTAAPAAANSAAPKPLTEVQRKVLAMPERQRNVVLIRALIDADLPCDGVMKSTRVEDQDGAPMWRAECKNGSFHLITITPDGMAKIFSHS